MLRFCYMLLHEGRWGDKQVVPKEFVQHATDDYHKTLEMVIASIVEKEKVPAKNKSGFQVHEINSFQNRMGATSLDMDKDGDPDYVFGRFGEMYWYEYTSPSKWVFHEIGKGAKTDVGGIPLDVNDDGLMDSWWVIPGAKTRARAKK